MRRRGRRPTDDERDLWYRAFGKPKQPNQPDLVIPETPRPVTLPRPARPPETAQFLRPIGRPEPAITLPKPPSARASGLDRATETRLRRGKRDPDAVLDLHGMTANRAHMALNRFIMQSRQAGHRMVLVVTGKGSIGAAREFGDPAPGILRRETPHWLSIPPLAQMVVNVTQAHPRHGGIGALYVYLKKIR